MMSFLLVSWTRGQDPDESCGLANGSARAAYSGGCSRGSGTMLAVAVIACGAVTALGLTTSSAALLSRQNLVHAADASAIAASDTRNGFTAGDPCRSARLVAAAFDAHVSLCRPCAEDMCIEVTSSFLGIAFSARSRARGAVA